MFLLVVTILFAARAQSSISFPITLQRVAPSVIGPGIYAISSLNAEGTEYFMTSSLYPNSKKGTKLKGERCVVDADEQTRRYVSTTKKPLSVVTLKEAVKIKLAATYSPAGVQYHRRGWA